MFPNLKCVIKIPIIIMHFNFFIFEFIYNLLLEIVSSKMIFNMLISMSFLVACIFSISTIYIAMALAVSFFISVTMK